MVCNACVAEENNDNRKHKLTNGCGKLCEKIGDCTVFTENFHAGRRNAGIQKRISDSAAHKQNICGCRVRCKRKSYEKHNEKRHSHQCAFLSSETVRKRPCNRKSYQPSQADCRNHRHDAADFKGAVRQSFCAPRSGKFFRLESMMG